jgi:hypothetical protein
MKHGYSVDRINGMNLLRQSTKEYFFSTKVADWVRDSHYQWQTDEMQSNECRFLIQSEQVQKAHTLAINTDAQRHAIKDDGNGEIERSAPQTTCGINHQRVLKPTANTGRSGIHRIMQLRKYKES